MYSRRFLFQISYYFHIEISFLKKKHIKINGKDKRNSEIVIEHLTIKEHAN
jgi:hypothetical protein